MRGVDREGKGSKVGVFSAWEGWEGKWRDLLISKQDAEWVMQETKIWGLS